MAAYHRVYDSHHMQADCKNRDQLRNPTLGNTVWATFTFLDGFGLKTDWAWSYSISELDKPEQIRVVPLNPGGSSRLWRA